MLVKSTIKYIQSLGQKKFREQEKLFIAEGPKLVKELIEADSASIKEIFAIKEWIDEQDKQDIKDVIREISDIELEKISQLTTPNKVVAIVKQYPAISGNGKTVAVKDRLVLALDNLQDPGNLGTIIRIADWFGIDQIVCNENTADLYNSKVVQATMGSIARVHVFYTNLNEWLANQKAVQIYLATLDGTDISTINKIKEGIIVIGNESKGINTEITNLASIKISIPKKGKAESLNAAVAAGIILSHTK
jgi:TrmH family RNA methyltransferase